MDDEPQVEQLENRIETLENTIEKMMPSRRDALKMGGAALAGGSLMAGTASAGTNQVGTIGSASQRVDLESEDINNADTITTDTLDSTTVNNSGTVTTQDLVVNGTATGPFGGGGIVFEEGDPINKLRVDRVSVASDSFFTIFDLANAVDVYGGSIYGLLPERIRITFASNNSLTLGNVGDANLGLDGAGDNYAVHPVFPMKDVKKLEGYNGSSATREYGFQVFTT